MPKFYISLSALVLTAFLTVLSGAASHAQAPTSAAPAASTNTPAIQTVSELSAIPLPNVAARAWLTLDINSDLVIAAQDLNTRVEPASLTKLMSAYLIFDALKQNRISLQDKVRISEKAWKTIGSRMFIEVDSRVAVEDLLKGMIVQSGNDATVALAEAVAGSEAAFVALMNEQAARQGLADTHFTNAPGLPDAQHYSSVRDLAMLSRNLIRDFPEYLHYYAIREYTWNNIRQPNRNRLLWLDDTVDGLKTGSTSSAGYCLIATAVRGGRRIVSVVVGADSPEARTEASLRLLNWSFQNFDTVKLFDEAAPVVQARVWEGTQKEVGLGQTQPLWLTVPRGKAAQIEPQAQYTQPLLAPLAQGTQVGTVTLTLDGKTLRQVPLAVLQNVERAGFFSRMMNKISRLF